MNMVGINASANSYILSNLRQINSDIATTQARIGTGRKVNSSSDNAIAWKTAQTIKSDQSAQEKLSTGIAQVKGRADAATAAIDTAITLAGKIKELADGVVAADPGTGNYGTVTAKVAALHTQIASVLSAAGFDGKNFLTDTAAAQAVTIGINSGVAATVSVTTVDVEAGAATTFSGIAAISDTATAATLSTAADTFIASVTAYQGTLATFSESLAIQQDFQSALSGIRSAALSSLLDADLTEESAKITALQTQQQLAYQALAITNSSAQNVLRLFQ
ncbi:flagellin [Aureimonas glaciei]|jgi:flagellin|uniref:Flagellin n=2 Tax=Aureimonas glaciei TaxID=1776957 RepID=A0A916YHE5_9HYPH|nr:flagellin [Aureimonas glaciei]